MRPQGHARIARAVACLVAILALTGLSPTAAQAQRTCDHDCLTGLITDYVDALVAHDPARLPLAPKVRFTEDSKELPLGEGVWKTVTGKGSFRQDYLDTSRKIAAAHVQLMEGKTQLLYSVLLHVSGRRIAGIETLVQRIAPDGRWQPTVLGAPIRGLNTPVPAGKKMARADMIKIALTYPEGLRIGNFTDGKTPFAADTYRVENGVVTAGAGCGRADCGMYAQHIMLHPSIVASVAAADEANGIVVLWMNFGYTDSYGPGNALVTFEAFKIWGGQIQSILAFFRPLPLATSRNWTTSDEMPK